MRCWCWLSAVAAAAFLLAFFSIKTNSAETEGGLDCPHVAFVRKHHCLHCQTHADALDFSKNRHDTNVNSVLFGPTAFTEEGGMCVNSERVRVVTCTLSTGHCTEKVVETIICLLFRLRNVPWDPKCPAVKGHSRFMVIFNAFLFA